jgi:predicted nucleotidyltransferase
MISGTELRVLSSFFPEGCDRSTKEVEERSAFSHELAHSTLKALEKKQILAMRNVGKTIVYSIKRFDDATFLSFLYYSLIIKESFLKKFPTASNAAREFIIKTKPEIVVLFGSYSKGEATESSDLDILCVNGIQEAEKIAMSLRHKYNLRINPVAMSKKDFPNIRSDNPEFWEDIVIHGIVLKGQEMFYDLVYPLAMQYNNKVLRE